LSVPTNVEGYEELLRRAEDFGPVGCAGVEGVLSARELEIVLLAARGLSNQQIASSLHLSEATVKRHLANIYPKMGVSSRGEAARKALQEDWITIEEITEPDPG
jgi:DNA-binding NarL/FixJ family response regulator